MPRKISKLPPRLIISLVSVVVLVLAVHFAGIAMLRYLVEKELHPALARGTHIAEAHLNLFTGLLEINGFELRVEGEKRLRARSLLLDIDAWQLLVGRIHVEAAEMRGVYVRLNRLQDGSLDFGLPPFGDSRQPVESDESFAFSMDGLVLSNARIDYRDADLRSDIVVHRLNLGAYSAQAEAQEIPLDWDMQWDGRLIKGDAVLKLAQGRISANGNLETGLLNIGRAERIARLGSTLDGEMAYKGTFDWKAPRIRLDGELKAPMVSYSIAERKVMLSGLQLPGFVLEVITEPSLVLELAPYKGARVELWETELAGHQVTGEVFRASGKLRYDDGNILELRDASYLVDSIGWRSGGKSLELSNVAISGQIGQSLKGDTPYPALEGRVATALIQYQDEAAAMDISLQELQLDEFVLSQLDENRTRQVSGQLKLASSQVKQADTSVGWSGVVAELGGRLGKDVVKLNTNISLNDISISSPVFVHGPLVLERLTADGLQLDEDVNFDKLRFEGLDLQGKPEVTDLKVGALEINEGQYSEDSGVSLGGIHIDGLQTAVIRDKEGQWRYPMSDTAAKASDEEVVPASDEASGEEPQAMPWRVGGVEVAGESYIQIADHLNPDMTAPRFKIEKLSVGALASDAVDADTEIELVMRPDKYSEFAINGKVRPMSEEIYIKAEGHVHAIALKSFNGLIADDLGHRFLSGQLDNNYRISIESNQLDMNNGLILSGVDAEEIPGKDGPPLTTAIALLEDRDGNIKLEVPVSGDLTDPQFRVLGALNPIIMKAVAGTAALAIQPLGSVLLVGSLLADQALKVTFEPAVFEPGVTGLSPDGEKYLGQLAEKLNDKPKLALRICGVAVEAERKKDKKGEYLDTEEELLAMAQQRADAARTYLSKQGVVNKQLRACRPAYDIEAAAIPRVDIKF